jgi:perosamine synthetase
MSKLAIDGGIPVRSRMLPYGHQSIEEDDIGAVADILRSDWLTTGPKVAEFERAFAKTVGAREAVAVSSGTAALHAAMFALGIGPGDEVIVPTMTFAASANCVVYQRSTPVFADVDAEALLLDPARVEALITPRTRAIVAVDYAGQPCDYDALGAIAERHKLALVADACHALGGNYKGKPVGSLADLNTFSFHPVKHITTGEGGMVTTDAPELAQRMRIFRNHGITTDHRQREKNGSWFYEMVELGYNYRMSDFQCALGLTQLSKLPAWIARRRGIAAAYDCALADVPEVRSLRVRPDVGHAYHLYVVQLRLERLRVDRARIFAALRAENIGVNVHYIPAHLHRYYRQHFVTGPGGCPVAEEAYGRLLTLPLFPAMTEQDVADVIAAVLKVCSAYRRLNSPASTKESR